MFCCFAEMASICACVCECAREGECVRAEDFYLSLDFIEISHRNNCNTYLDYRIIVVVRNRQTTHRTVRKKTRNNHPPHNGITRIHMCYTNKEREGERERRSQQQQEALILNNFPMIFIVVC